MVKLMWWVRYRLDSQGVVAWFPSGDKKFFTSPKHLQSGSEDYPVCYSMVTMWGSLPGSKAAASWSWLLTTRHKFKNVWDILPLQHIFSLHAHGQPFLLYFHYYTIKKLLMLTALISHQEKIIQIRHLTFQCWKWETAFTQSCHKFCPKYIVTYKKNETEHPLFKSNNLLAIVLSFYL
jgi:hypothetical protein